MDLRTKASIAATTAAIALPVPLLAVMAIAVIPEMLNRVYLISNTWKNSRSRRNEGYNNRNLQTFGRNPRPKSETST
jgi:hypothetical protein